MKFVHLLYYISAIASRYAFITIVTIKLTFNLFTSRLFHPPLLLIRQSNKPFDFLYKIILVLLFYNVAIHAIIYNLSTTRSVCSNNRSTCGTTFYDTFF